MSDRVEKGIKQSNRTTLIVMRLLCFVTPEGDVCYMQMITDVTRKSLKTNLKECV